MRFSMYVCTLALILAPLACGGDEGATGSSPAVNAACDLMVKCGVFSTKSECLGKSPTICSDSCESAMMDMVDCTSPLSCGASEEEVQAQCGDKMDQYRASCEPCFAFGSDGPPEDIPPGIDD